MIMEHQKIINLLDNTQNEPSKFRTRNWAEINNESRGAYKDSNQIKFKTSIMRSNLCDYSEAYILVSGTMTINGAEADDNATRLDERKKGVTMKNCAPFTKCISNINTTQIDNGKYIDVVTPMDNLVEYRDNYSKKSASLWQYSLSSAILLFCCRLININ